MIFAKNFFIKFILLIGFFSLPHQCQFNIPSDNDDQKLLQSNRNVSTTATMFTNHWKPISTTTTTITPSTTPILSSSAIFRSSILSMSTSTTPSPFSSSSLSTTTFLTSPHHDDTFSRLIEQSIAKTYRSFEKRYRNCPSLRNSLKNGYVKLRSYPNRVARFTCNKGFDLIGNRYSTCSRNRWTHDLPVCVSTNCPNKLNVQPPLSIRKISNHSSVVDLHCQLGYRLQLTNKKINGKKINFFDSIDHGSSSSLSYPTLSSSSIRAYCIGKQWFIDDPDQPDHSFTTTMIPLDQWPTCEIYEKPMEKSMNCTFENQYGSICGWMQDNEDDFDWTRNFLQTPSHYDETGPSFDHTFGENGTGNYLYLESSYPRSPNEVARLYSPVFQHVENSSVACFQFYYHMYGKACGTLRMFVKEKNQQLSQLEPVWEMSGDQGDQWLAGQIEIQPANSSMLLQPFQIIIEGILGNGHQGDIAIDDLQLTLAKSCSSLTNSTLDVDIINEPSSIADLDPTDSPPLNSINSSSSTSKLPEPSKWYGYPIIDDNNGDDDDITDSQPQSNDQSLHNEIIRSIVHLKPIMTTTTTTMATTTKSTSTTMTKPSSTTTTILQTMPTTSTTTISTNTDRKSPSSSSILTTLKSVVTTESSSASNESSIEAKARINMEDDNKKHRFNAHWSLIWISIIGLLLLIMAIVYIGYMNLPLKSSSSTYRFAAIFINRCKLFQSTHNNDNGNSNNNHYQMNDDSELLMVNDNDNNQQQFNHLNHSFDDNHCVYLQPTSY
ncbi:uncharacterized protein LOC113794829 [Dermatophagoides pteronyssinus]|uniref:uncharacterized protein LOC113794829 n=1 Tax=Dermatophagoides pteronyssinus TaxID=6956 RepID=UPI003F66C566